MTMTKWTTDAEIDAAAKADCCPDVDCIPAASYCAVVKDRERIRRILRAAAAVRDNGEEVREEKQ